MSDPPQPFDLEDEAEHARPPRRVPSDPAGEGGDSSAGNGRPGAVDERTVAERRGAAVDPVAGRRAAPVDWPREALRFPLRRPGPGSIAGGVILWILLDFVTSWNLFVGWVLKLLALLFYLRWQIHEGAMSAGGHDRPRGWQAAMDMTPQHLGRLGRFLLAALVLSAPGAVLWALGHRLAGVLLLVFAGWWLAVGALGMIVGERGYLWPWRTLGWIRRRPLALLVATAGWWGAGMAEWAAIRFSAAGTGVAFLGSVAVRAAWLYVWLVSARVLGVVGRDWSPWTEDRETSELGSSVGGG